MTENADDDLAKKVTAIVAKYSRADEIRKDSRLQRDLGLDSFDLVNIVMDAQESLGVSAPGRTLPFLTTMSDVIEYVRRLAAQRSGHGPDSAAETNEGQSDV